MKSFTTTVQNKKHIKIQLNLNLYVRVYVLKGCGFLAGLFGNILTKPNSPL